MSDLIFTLAQFILIIWPLFILTALVYSLQLGSAPHSRSRRARKLRARAGILANRIRHNLLATWTFLLVVWVVTLFAPTDTPSLMPEPWNTIIFLGGYIVLLFIQAMRLGMFRRRLVAHVDLHRAREIADLKSMDPYAFEGLITETYRAYGFNVQHVGHSGDHGIDIEMHAKNGEHWIVQCKRYNDSVGESIIRDLYGTLIADRADRAALVTTAEITPPARAWAQGKPIELVDGPALLALIAGARERSAGTLLDRLAQALNHLFEPRGVSLSHAAPGPASTTGPLPASFHPLRVTPSANHRIHYQKGAPICPRCGLVMAPRPAQPTDHPGRVLYRCQNYPTCRVVLEGEPAQPEGTTRMR